jgi:hypothetical protein
MNCEREPGLAFFRGCDLLAFNFNARSHAAAHAGTVGSSYGVSKERNKAMTTQTRDTHFAGYVDALASSCYWPSGTFRLRPWEAFVGTLFAFFDTWRSPNDVVVRAALQGIAL